MRLVAAGPRRWRWLAAGAALMVLGALLAAAAVAQSAQRSGYVAAARDLPAGHILASEDLKVVELAGAESLAVVSAERLGEAVGRRLLTPLSEQTLIPQTALGAAGDYPGEGEAVVGASLAANQYPSSLRAGARVSVIITGQSTEGGEGEQGGSAGAPEAVPARVQAITPPGESAGEAALVELVVDAADAAEVAAAASAGAVSVVEVPGSPG
ncbi:SAF domain-containing protein [Nocardiopsis composta]|uniref:SAF domain-containing protein n=1 Tax=Nocardiopsis composta TaxID=157465 RepID=A0A7W8VBI8_9ACTN|nr:SAF domain-containing protein [Nocardiopsis composta]MBB5429924.1 hypothetical protein [Nocardiopsis composta]